MSPILAPLLALSIGVNIGLVVRVVRPPEPADRAAPHAPPPPRELDRMLARHVERMTEDLGLDDQQLAALREAHGTLFPSILETHAHVESLGDDAARAFAEEVNDPDAFRARVGALQGSRARLDSLLTEVFLAEVAILDASQRDRYIRGNPWSRRLEGPPRGDRRPRGDRPPPGHRPPPGEGPPPPR